MLTLRGRRTLFSALLLVTVTAAACSDGGTETAESTVGSDTVPTVSSSSSSIPSPTAPSPTTPPPTALSPVPTRAPAPPRAVPPFVASATWGGSDYGVTLRVAPTPSALRAGGFDDADLAWAEVLRLAPDADTPGMREQFDCHWTWARLLEPDKPTWNLEPWRPVVEADRMLLEGCNPGGPEV
ncbi:DUF2599 domain-containing protein [Dietzia aerolata]|uniref:DUF2599 domain-containing protein n=1 Tax=Dietzia aerolata TaxID=595984 RepID=A0ABV5JRX8_9ACTN|nr:DUF2599 domain-containing protein [Dietzia aerolata]MBB0970495.1 DUF2599 domain-containing protein [Dietzia aerolata]